MENAPSVVNHLVKSPAGKSEAEKGGRIIQKGNNSAKAVFIESQDGDHISKTATGQARITYIQLVTSGSV